MIICLLHVSSVSQEHFLEVIQNQEFLLLPTAEIVKLLSSDDINVPDEETIFQALMMWVRYDVQHRQQDLGVLLAYIRLPLLPPQVRLRIIRGWRKSKIRIRYGVRSKQSEIAIFLSYKTKGKQQAFTIETLEPYDHEIFSVFA